MQAALPESDQEPGHEEESRDGTWLYLKVVDNRRCRFRNFFHVPGKDEDCQEHEQPAGLRKNEEFIGSINTVFMPQMPMRKYIG